jgi:hypothetical protein
MRPQTSSAAEASRTSRGGRGGRSDATSNRRALRMGASLLALSCALLASPSAATATGFPRTGPRVTSWAPEHIGTDHRHTRREAVRIARRFDLVVAVRGAFDGLVDDMRRANRNIVVLVYLNGTFAQENQGRTYPNAWYARDGSGRKVRSRGYGNYLMKPSHAGWVDHVRDRCARSRSRSGYMGCFLDMLGTASLEPGYLTGVPIDPRTGEPWTKGDWISATSSLAAAVKRRIDPHFVAGNGLRNGNVYFDPGAPSESLLRGIDGGCAESWLRVATEPVRRWPSRAEWKRNVDMLRDVGAKGKSVLVLTKLWVRATDAQEKRWHRFALGSFLLGDTGRSYFHFSGARGRSPVRSHRWWRKDLGPPLRPYERAGNAYLRVFSRGKVIVNPTDTRVRVRLRGLYATLSGTKLRSVTVPPHDAAILREL